MVNEQVIYINKHLQKRQYILLILLVLGIVAGYYLSQLSPTLFGWVTSPITLILYGLYFIGILVISGINGQKKIVFSGAEQTVYSQTLFGKKHLMAFGDIGAIKPYSTTFGGLYFALFSRNNLYERNPIRISPPYSGGSRSRRVYDEFERTVLPQLWAIIGANLVPEARPEPAVSSTGLIYYREADGVYWLKTVYSQNRWSYALVAVLVGVSTLILTSSALRLKYLNVGIGIGLGAGIMAFLLTEKKYVQQGRFFSEYASGVFRRSYPLTQFSTFQIIHRRYNFVYVGTDVNLLFGQPTKENSLFLCQIRKTKKIEELLRETEFIIDQQRQQFLK